MYSKQEVESTNSNLSLAPLPYAENYLKFCSPSKTNFENATAVLSNYCTRDWLQWAPKGPFQRMGKNRSSANIKAVEQALTNPGLHSVTMLIATINDQIKNYADDSSLLKRLLFICAMENIPCQVVKTHGGTLTLQLGSASTITLASSSTKIDSSKLLLQSYLQYPLLPEYTDKHTIASEDHDYEGVTVTNDPKKLKLGENYLYVLTPEGQVWFAPQFAHGVKLTHGGLARKANLITGNTAATAVLTAGTISFGEKDAIFNLASGHFQPEFGAYLPLLETLGEQLPDYTLMLQRRHYKSLDERECIAASLDLVAGIRQFKLNLLDYLQQPHSSDLSAIAHKIFLSINTADKDYKEDISFSHSELATLFDDSELSGIVKASLSYCPDEIKEYGQKLSDTISFVV